MIKKNNFKQKKILKKLLKFFVIYCFLAISIKIYTTTSDNIKKSKELKNLEKKLEYNAHENQKLREQLETGLTENYIEKRARNDLNMINPNERVFFSVPLEKN